MSLIEFDESGNVKRPSKPSFYFLSKREEIDDAQRKFEEKLKSGSDQRIHVDIGWQGGNTPADVYYSSTLDFWFYFDKLLDEPIPRYWNVFGLGKPKKNSNVSIITEINFPFFKSLKVAGVLAGKGSKEIWIYHTGKINGMTLKKFWENYRGPREHMLGKDCAELGNIDSQDFISNVRKFVAEVSRIKKLR